MSDGFPINPPNAPLVFPDGRCTNEWWRFFYAIQRRIGGSSNPWDSTALLASSPDLGSYALGEQGKASELATPPVITVVPEDMLLRPPSGLQPEDMLPPPFALQIVAQLIALQASVFTTGGALSLKARTITATGGINNDDYTILADATGGAITVNLPAAASSTGLLLNIKKIDASANAVTIDPNGAETIDGAATKALTTQYASYAVQCDGTAWWII